MTSFGIGLLGCGRISENHLNGYRHGEGLDGLGEIVALCDTNGTLIEQQGSKHQVATRYTRLQDLLADDRVTCLRRGAVHQRAR